MNAETFTMPIHVEFAQRWGVAGGICRPLRRPPTLMPRPCSSNPEFDDLLQRTRKTGGDQQGPRIVQSWERPRFQTVEEIAISNKWGLGCERARFSHRLHPLPARSWTGSSGAQTRSARPWCSRWIRVHSRPTCANTRMFSFGARLFDRFPAEVSA